ncbi:MAG: DeoR family transcriptional regulator [Acidimicrobiia bacterium]
MRGGVAMNVDALDRIEAIKDRLEHDGRVRIRHLAADLGVSDMTIRRDLDLLAEQGVARRVRGGAVTIGPRRFPDRTRDHPRAKSVIAQKLVDLVPDRGAVALDASSTVQRLAARLTHVHDLTVLTNGPETFSALQGQPGVRALLTGGELDARTGSLVGPLAARSAGDLLVDRLFVGAAALDADLGSSEATLDEAEIKLALAAGAAEIVLAVDSSKLGSRGTARAFPIDRVALLVTELDPQDQRLDPFRDRCALR